MNDLAQLAPRSVTVSFTASGFGAPDPPVYAVNVTLASLALTQYAGITGTPWTHTLHRYDVAQYPGPVNSAALTAMATQMVKDWYLWQLARLDQQIDGFFDWTQEGMHDIEWRQGRGRITTRITRGPFNPQEDLLMQILSAPTITNIFNSNTFYETIINIITEIIFDPGESFNVVNNVCAYSLVSQKIGTLITLSAVEQTLVTMTITILQPTEALVFGTIDFDANGAAAGDTYQGRLYVDGTLQTLRIPWAVPTTASRANVGQVWKVSLSAGTHTLLLKALQLSGGGTFARSNTNTNLALQTPTAVVVQGQQITMATGTVATDPACVSMPATCCATGDDGGGSGGTNCAITCGTAPACGLPNTMTVTVAGLVDGDCADCDTFNVARVLKLINAKECRWGIDFDNICDAAGLPNYMDVVYLPEVDKWYIASFIGSDVFTGVIAGSAWDCEGPNVFTVTLSGANCTGTITATVTIPACDEEVIATECCDPVPTKLCVILTLSGATDGNYDFEWSPADEWWENVDAIGSCGAGTVTIRCNTDPEIDSLFILTVNSLDYVDDTHSECNPITAVFSSVVFTACGGGAAGTVTVTTGACSADTGTIATLCCPDDLLPAEMNLAFDGGVGCACLTDDYTLTYAEDVFSSGIDGWGWTGSVCGEAVEFIFYCSDATGLWELNVSVGAQAQSSTFPTFDCATCTFTFETFATFSVGACGPADMSAVVSCAGGGGGGGACVPRVATKCCSLPLPEVLNITFTGALDELGTLALTYDSGRWIGTYASATLSATVTFKCVAGDKGGGVGFTLFVRATFGGGDQCVGITFRPAECDPFVWASGTQLLESPEGGPCNGFEYTATASC